MQDFPGGVDPNSQELLLFVEHTMVMQLFELQIQIKLMRLQLVESEMLVVPCRPHYKGVQKHGELA